MRKYVVALLTAAVTVASFSFERVHAAPVNQAVFDPPTTDASYSIGPAFHGYVTASDGTQLHVEVVLPAPLGAHVPPARVPVVVYYSYYTATDQRTPSAYLALRDQLVPRGYAVVLAAARGTGLSGGCFDEWSDLTADDGSRFVEWAGSQPWSKGQVGLYGQSGSATNAWATALEGDRDRVRPLKAVVAVAGFSSVYDAVHMDGAANAIRNAGDSLAFNAYGLITTDPTVLPDRACGLEHPVAGADTSGDFTPYFQQREHRDGVARMSAPTLVAQGVHDLNVLPRAYAGLLNRWPKRVPLKVMLGSYRHGSPTAGDGNAAAKRADWFDMATAWFDRWLKGTDTGVESWPDYQVQDANGQWRVERQWVGARRDGALALSAGGLLGASRPTGSTTYLQAEADGRRATIAFITPPLADDLHIYGDPVLELSVEVTDPAARIGVRLDILDDSGAVRGVPYSSNFAARSLRHRAPYVAGRFAQERGEDPPLGEMFRTTIRLQPTDMLVPAGSRLRLALYSLVGSEPGTVSGGIPWPSETTGVEGSTGTITVHHDCDNPTVLRFAMADPNATLLTIAGATTATGSSPEPGPSPLRVDGGGLATEPIC